MAIWKSGRQGKKASGARFWPGRKKRAYEIGSDPINTRISEKETKKTKKLRGGKTITQILTATHANLQMAVNKFKKSKLITVKENSANRHFVRMNVLTKGAVIETEDGLAKVMSRPSRSGIVNAILLKK
ncbi:MAG: 30S ribosomal protein S8e [DPANN group archaeon]|nr:30S ribosomal protein S8e [DPANN group archaeon]